MPNGVIHEQLRKRGRWIAFPLSLIVPVILSPLPLRTGLNWCLGLGMILGYEMGKYVTSDWDCVTMTKDELKMTEDIPIIGHFLFGVSSTYGSIFKRHHRSKRTHVPVLSTSIRFAMLFWWAGWMIYWSTWDLAWLTFVFIGMFVGLSESDTIHWWADNYYEEK